MKINFLILAFIILLWGCSEPQTQELCSENCFASVLKCSSLREVKCPKNCYQTNQTPISIFALYEAYSGSVIACPLPIRERLIAAYNAQRTLKDGQLHLPYAWESTLWPLRGTFELLSFQQEENTDCFKYKQVIDVDGAILTAHGMACQDPYKVWRIVNEIPNINPWVTRTPDSGLKLSQELKMRVSRFVD